MKMPHGSLYFRLVSKEIGASKSILLFFMLCLALGVASVAAVSGLNAQVKVSISDNSRALLGGDVEIQNYNLLNEAAVQSVLQNIEVTESTRVTRLSAMGRSDKNQTGVNVSLYAVDARFPIVKHAIETDPPNAFELLARSQSGALVAQDAAANLELKKGDLFEVSGVTFHVVGFVTREVSAQFGSLFMGPKIYVRRSDAADTPLLQKTSRLRDILLLNTQSDPRAFIEKMLNQWKSSSAEMSFGPSALIRAHDTESQGTVNQGNESPRNAPTGSRALRNLNFFLAQIALAALLMTCLGVATGLAELIRARHSDVAIYRALGAKPKLPSRVLGSVVLILNAAGVAFGVFIGELLRIFLLSPFLKQNFNLEQTTNQDSGLFYALSQMHLPWDLIFSATFLPFLFLYPTLKELEKIPPATVLREGSFDRIRPAFTTYLSWAAGLAILLYLFTSSAPQLWVGTLLFFVNIFLFVVFYALIRLLLGFFERNESRIPLRIRLAIGEIASRRTTSLLSVCLIGISVFFVTTVQVLKDDLLGSLVQNSEEAEKPNLFFIDVQKDQADQLKTLLTELTQNQPDAAPITRARLIKSSETKNDAASLNNSQTSHNNANDSREREQNLTWRTEIGSSEEIVDSLHELPLTDTSIFGSSTSSQKNLWAESNEPEVSLEVEFAKRMEAKLGDTLIFDLAGIQLSAKVTSLRKVDWQSFRPNFFILVKPVVMEGAPHQVLMSVFAGESEKRRTVQQTVLEKFPNVTVIDTTQIIASALEIASQISRIASVLSLMLLFSGIMILVSGLVSTRKARMGNTAIIRSLGASNQVITASLVWEFFLLGSISGAMGTLAAVGIGQILSIQVLGTTTQTHILAPFLIWLGVTVFVSVVGLLVCRSVLTTKPTQIWRESL